MSKAAPLPDDAGAVAAPTSLADLQRQFAELTAQAHDVAEQIKTAHGDCVLWLPLKSVDTGGFSCERIRQLAEARKIKARKVGGRWEIDADDLERYLVAHRKSTG